MRKIIPLVLILAFAAPQLAFASWWNPLTWSIFNRSVLIPPTVSTVATSTTDLHVSAATSTPDIATSTKTQANFPIKPKVSPSMPKTFAPDSATIPKPVLTTPAGGGGGPQPAISGQVPAASADQIKRITWMCNLNAEMKSNCDKLLPYYYTNASVKVLLDSMAVNAEQQYLKNQSQQVADQKTQQAACLMKPLTPGLSYQQQMYIQSKECGTATPQSDLNYKLYQQQQYQDCVTKNPANYDTYCAYLKPIFY